MPLNKLELQKDVWREVRAMSQSQQIKVLDSLLREGSDNDYPQLVVEKDCHGSLHVYTIDGLLETVTTPRNRNLWVNKTVQQSEGINGADIDNACVPNVGNQIMIDTIGTTEQDVDVPAIEDWRGY